MSHVENEQWEAKDMKDGAGAGADAKEEAAAKLADEVFSRSGKFDTSIQSDMVRMPLPDIIRNTNPKVDLNGDGKPDIQILSKDGAKLLPKIRLISLLDELEKANDKTSLGDQFKKGFEKIQKPELPRMPFPRKQH